MRGTEVNHAGGKLCNWICKDQSLKLWPHYQPRALTPNGLLVKLRPEGLSFEAQPHYRVPRRTASAAVLRGAAGPVPHYAQTMKS